MADRSRISYDRVWGALLLLGCLLPYEVGPRGTRFLWHALGDLHGRPAALLWLALGTLAGLVGFLNAVLKARGRFRHFLNFALGVGTLALPILRGEVWEAFPAANPARIPFYRFGSVGWVTLAAMVALYAGSGIRIVRPSQIAGQVLGAMGALLLAIFFFLPGAGGSTPPGIQRIQQMDRFAENWRDLVPFVLIFGGALVGTLNLLRSRVEVPVAKFVRFLLVAGLLFVVFLPRYEEWGQGRIRAVELLPVVFGALRLFGPLFLSVDGCVAYVAISITRGGE